MEKAGKRVDRKKHRRSGGKDRREREVVTVAEEVKHMDLRADGENMSGEER